MKYLTVEVLTQVLVEHDWPSYTLEDEGDGITMVMPDCALHFREGFESEMSVIFVDVDLEYSVDLTEVLIALRAEGKLPDVPSPRPVAPPIAGSSLQKVTNELRDLCNLLQAYLPRTLAGDFGWVDAVKRFRAAKVVAQTAMNRSLTMDAHGNFFLGDDPDGVIAEALSVATASSNLEALEPDGDGLHVQGVATIKRVSSREELPMQCDSDPTLDPETQELWALYRERDRTHRAAATVIAGDELRTLVRRAIRLREGNS